MKRMAILFVLMLASMTLAGRKLTTNEATIIQVGPLVDATDGITPETALDVTTVTVELYLAKDNGTGATRTTFVPTASGGSNDMTLVASSVSGVYNLELTSAQLNATGSLLVTVVDTDSASITAAPWKDTFTLTSANRVDDDYGTDNRDVNIVEIGSDTTSDDNLVMLVNSAVSVYSTVSATGTTRSLNITALTLANNGLKNQIIAIQDLTDSHWESRRIVRSYSTGTVVLDEPLTFVPVVNDIVCVFTLGYGGVDESGRY